MRVAGGYLGRKPKTPAQRFAGRLAAVCRAEVEALGLKGQKARVAKRALQQRALELIAEGVRA